jgi:hypothetical protein
MPASDPGPYGLYLSSAVSSMRFRLMRASASGRGSRAFGEQPAASGRRSRAVGARRDASGQRSHAVGARPNASGQQSHAVGARPDASGQRHLAVGARPGASGQWSLVMGRWPGASGRPPTRGRRAPRPSVPYAGSTAAALPGRSPRRRRERAPSTTRRARIGSTYSKGRAGWATPRQEHTVTPPHASDRRAPPPWASGRRGHAFRRARHRPGDCPVAFRNSSPK